MLHAKWWSGSSIKTKQINKLRPWVNDDLILLIPFLKNVLWILSHVICSVQNQNFYLIKSPTSHNKVHLNTAYTSCAVQSINEWLHDHNKLFYFFESERKKHILNNFYDFFFQERDERRKKAEDNKVKTMNNCELSQFFWCPVLWHIYHFLALFKIYFNRISTRHMVAHNMR